MYNIGGGPNNATSLLELVNGIERSLQVRVKHRFRPARPGDQPIYITDFSKFSEHTNWHPEIRLSQTIDDISQWYHANRSAFVPTDFPVPSCKVADRVHRRDRLMKFALVNPAWDFRRLHLLRLPGTALPSGASLRFDQIAAAGHEPLLIDAQSDQLSMQQVKKRLAEFDPNFLVIPTAPSYLFWRCPPPELRVPQTWFRELELQSGESRHWSA